MEYGNEPRFVLPGKIDIILASLACYCAKKNMTELHRVVVNSKYHIVEGWTYDNWDGGSYGHALYLRVPSELYFDIVDSVGDIAHRISNLIGNFANVQGEFISSVFVELQEEPVLGDWRERSGVLIHQKPQHSTGDSSSLNNIWKSGYFRLFISHKAEYKEETARLKEEMACLGVSCFVAHEDIEPTERWQREIEKALFSMDALLALMTESFSNSNWTDQEIGIAIGREVPIISVRLGKDPYGFIGKYQGVAGNGKSSKKLAKEIYQILWNKLPFLKSRLMESIIARFENSECFDHANELFKYIETLTNVPPNLIDRIEKAPDKNRQVREAYEVKYHLQSLIMRLRKSNP
jgi:hypothetical protein